MNATHLSTAEQIRDAVARLRAQLLKYLEQYVNLETPSDAPELLSAALPRIEQMITQIAGAPATRLLSEHEGYGPHIVLEFPSNREEAGPESSAGDADWVTALCHYDTVWPAGTTQEWPFSLEGDVARGPGVFDMKAGLLQLLFAIQVLDTLGLYRPHVRLVLNSDEEIGSPSSRKLIEESVQRAAGPVLVFEAAGEGGALKTERKGVGIFSVEATGKEAHAGLDPGKGVSAIDEIARAIIQLHALSDLDAGTSVNVGVLSGGTRTNVFAGTARAEVDVRVSSVEEVARIDAALAGLKAHHPAATLTVGGAWNRPVMARSERGAALFSVAQAAGAELGHVVEEISVGGASDGNFAAAAGATVLDGLGAVGSGAHARSEHISISATLDRIALAALLLHRVGGEWRD